MPPAKWSKIEREAMREVRGRVLDVGCGPGRHAVYLQRKGHRVVGVDASPTQVALARVRGLQEVYQASVQRLPRGLAMFDTVILMGNNLVLAGDRPRPAPGIALPARALQRPRRGLVRPLAALTRRPRGPRARDGLGPRPGHLRAAR